MSNKFYNTILNWTYDFLKVDNTITDLKREDIDLFRFKSVGVNTMLIVNSSSGSLVDIKIYCYNPKFYFRNDHRMYYLFNELNRHLMARFYYHVREDMIYAESETAISSVFGVAFIHRKNLNIALAEAISRAVVSWRKAEKLIESVLNDMDNSIELDDIYIRHALLTGDRDDEEESEFY